MIIFGVVIVSGIGCLVLFVWWLDVMRKILLLNEAKIEAHKDDDKVVITKRRRKK